MKQATRFRGLFLNFLCETLTKSIAQTEKQNCSKAARLRPKPGLVLILKHLVYLAATKRCLDFLIKIPD